MVRWDDVAYAAFYGIAIPDNAARFARKLLEDYLRTFYDWKAVSDCGLRSERDLDFLHDCTVKLEHLNGWLQSEVDEEIYSLEHAFWIWWKDLRRGLPAKTTLWDHFNRSHFDVVKTEPLHGMEIEFHVGLQNN